MSVSWRRTAPYAFAQQRIGKERYTVDESGWLPLQPIQGCPVPTNAAGNEVRRSYQSIVINAPTQSGHTRARAAN